MVDDGVRHRYANHLLSLPTNAATSLISDPARELSEAEVLMANGLEDLLDKARDNRFLNADYVAFFTAAVAVDPAVLEIKDTIQPIFEVLDEDAAVSLVDSSGHGVALAMVAMMSATGILD